MNPLDELFKHKLEDHSIPPSPIAWSKVEDVLSKKSRTIIWFRIAACVALLGLGWGTYQQIANMPPKVITVASKEILKKEEAKNMVTTQDKILKITPAKSINTIENKLTSPVAVANENSTKKVITTNETVVLERIIKETITEQKELIANVEKPLVIEYTLEPVIDQPQEVTSRSRFQKMVDFALDAKHSDGALTNLRQAKDDLFAFNFKKDKSKPVKN